jgi:hypothetical protein
VSLAKPVFGLSSGIVIDIAGIDAVKQNPVLADQNHALAVGHRCWTDEVTRARGCP